jgi:hypothetical protein
LKPVSETPTEPSDYAAISLVFGSLLAGLAASSLSAATFSLSRLIVHDKAESWLREPFVAEEGDTKRARTSSRRAPRRRRSGSQARRRVGRLSAGRRKFPPVVEES